jgi:hypothetical protein
MRRQRRAKIWWAFTCFVEQIVKTASHFTQGLMITIDIKRPTKFPVHWAQVIKAMGVVRVSMRKKHRVQPGYISIQQLFPQIRRCVDQQDETVMLNQD